MSDKWNDLWNVATDDSKGVAKIVPNSDDQDEVALEWSDGTYSYVYWCYDTESWEFHECLNIFPGDVRERS